MIDPVCFNHGMRWSEHEHGRCLYCCLCFKPLTLEECAFEPNGDRVDICVPCREAELAVLIDLAQKYNEMKLHA